MRFWLQMRGLVFLWAAALLAGEGNPVVRSWLVNPAAQSAGNAALRAVLPDVQSVRVDGAYVYVESAGLSLHSLGAVEGNDRVPNAGTRDFVFRFPLAPRPADGEYARTPPDVLGALLNGVPIYNPVSPVSYRDQNLWHLDAVAALCQQARAESPLLTSLLQENGRHSPLIGFALDGYPIYGPYGWDSGGKGKRFRSSYRLRAITRRMTLPDGTELTPSQEGPVVGAEFPLGMYAEDYEYIAGSGDLDEHNGRITRTPEYPGGTYAYFLSSYPYLAGPTYFGYVAPRELPAMTEHHAPLDGGQIDLATRDRISAGQPVALTFSILDARGHKLRFLEKVHEQPIHLMIVSTDLAEFAHIHPELQSGDNYTVSYTFPHGGTYWLFADYKRPGTSQSISRFRLSVKGAARPAEAMHPDSELTKTQDGLRVKLTLPRQLRTGTDLTFRFDVPVDDLEPYLGAWAHIMILSEDRQEFIHAHPSDEVGQHTHAAAGPSPRTVSTVTGFRKPGLYRLWVQFQRQGKVITVPYTIKVDPEEKKPRALTQIPTGAFRVRVSDSGFVPARITMASGKPAVLAFERLDAQNCASSVVFPELGIQRALPAGETVVVEIPDSGSRELHFACGMNMYRGALVIR